MGFLAVHYARGLADSAVTSPLFAWTWASAADETFTPRLAESRPADSQTVVEMMDGKYLLGGTLIDTDGVSPFSTPDMPPAFFAKLHGFSWLRHFRDLRDSGQRRFARTLLMDWIGRHGAFERRVWEPALTAHRVLNWLKNFSLLTDGATFEQQRTINRVLARQVQSLKLRQSLIDDPASRLLAVVALAAAALSSNPAETELEASLTALERQLGRQVDENGLHKSRSPSIQLQLLSELIAICPILAERNAERGEALARRIDLMRGAFERLILPTGEPGYFNGCGQLAVEEVMAVSGISGGRAPAPSTPALPSVASGYGVLIDGRGVVVADSGLVPPLAYAKSAHAGALSFEFACGNTLVVGNCGPTPTQLPESGALFRQTSAHSAPTVDEASSAALGGPSALSSRLRRRGHQPDIVLADDGDTLEMTSHGYMQRYGLTLRRRLSLLGGGQTLVGQDTVIGNGRQPRSGELVIRFHLGPGAQAERDRDADLIRITYRSGEAWTFLWESADAFIEESVRHSLHFGLAHVDQIVLTAPAVPKSEVAWVFTRETP